MNMIVFNKLKKDKKMLFNNYHPKDKKSNSNKKVHRRVITEVEEPRYDIKKTDKIGSKPKFIDVYSKYLPKETTSNRRNFKIYSNKPVHP